MNADALSFEWFLRSSSREAYRLFTSDSSPCASATECLIGILNSVFDPVLHLHRSNSAHEQAPFSHPGHVIVWTFLFL